MARPKHYPENVVDQLAVNEYRLAYLADPEKFTENLERAVDIVTTDRSRSIFMNRFKPATSTTEQVGEKLGITREYVSMSTLRTLDRLRFWPGAKSVILEGFMDTLVDDWRPLSIIDVRLPQQLTTRAKNCLLHWAYVKSTITYPRQRIEMTVGDVINMTEEDILHLRNAGPATLKDIKSWLRAMGLRLKESNRTEE